MTNSVRIVHFGFRLLIYIKPMDKHKRATNTVKLFPPLESISIKIVVQSIVQGRRY